MESGLEGRVALVTGGGSGIGREAVLAFVRAGARVVVADLNLDSARTVADEAVAIGGKAAAVRVDVASEESVRDMVRATVDAFGQLDAAFNSAGIGEPATLLDVTEAQWDRMFAINVKGILYSMRQQILWMREHGGGAIVNAASKAGLGAVPGEAHYIAAKHAVVGLTRAAALEHAADAIRVNAIAPAFVDTPLIANAPRAALDAVAATTPLRRMAQPREVADAAVWLSSPAASYITGVILPVDGGLGAA
ncbi:SDR family NAD(P)-dependent oxidoreductase [Microbacterium sp. SORGH_AS_0888]|uniref:SDR family NAD(P)-dependent oxidoreductase n=1 Tax=Microbacterium sp. SORGH_AS_0888 TaxID=3041791 RepID=UPI0027847498|nr:SDR family NAD(P)-dependent oxidoreductase [Microbacterium sp. SORGH_AS_0888]MDQ1129532.1 NAD(P)-dependent dehydrogenase (short-subunit alcohol dehydrogenase family) [Microbacterium sp. SORGH_AS_0888]